MTSSSKSTDEGSGASAVTAPQIAFPKGDGAIRRIGEKFAANPVTGTGSRSVPIATSPGRSGFEPQLSLTYDSGAGSGPFGFGCTLSPPSITRKTDKGLPQYLNAVGSDVFILSGAEDLVPVLVQDANGKWVREDLPPRTIDGKAYRILRYRPRIEGLFTRIEHWTNTGDATDVFWCPISKDNITTGHGKTAEKRITDLAAPSRILSRLSCASRDDKGNVIAHSYKPEESERIFEDAKGSPIAEAHERNRSDETSVAQRYLKRIRYGHDPPYFPSLKANDVWPESPPAPWSEAAGIQPLDGRHAWMFEAVLDLGETDTNAPSPKDGGIWPTRIRSHPIVPVSRRGYRTCQP